MQSSGADATYESEVTPPVQSTETSRSIFQSEPLQSTADARYGEELSWSQRASLVGIRVDAQGSPVQDFAGKCCAICFDDNDCDVIELQCGGYHRFHQHCITHWLEASISEDGFVCPICRGRLHGALSGREMRFDGVFENTPTLDESYIESTIDIEESDIDIDMEAVEELPQESDSDMFAYFAYWTFESVPLSSAAHASARSMFESSTPRECSPRRSGVFENTPMPSSADISARLPSDIDSDTEVVEELPQEFGIDIGAPMVTRGSTPLSSVAHAPATSRFNIPSTLSTRECSLRRSGVFENSPMPSSADVAARSLASPQNVRNEHACEYGVSAFIGACVRISSSSSLFMDDNCLTVPQGSDVHASRDNRVANIDSRECRPRRRLRSPSSWIVR